MDSSTANLLAGSFPIDVIYGWILLQPYFREFPVLTANSLWLDFIETMFYRSVCFKCNRVDPDQMPPSAASDLCLHCLPMSYLGSARRKLVNVFWW